MCGNFIKWILCSFGWCFFYIVFICVTNYQCKFKYIDFLVGVMMFKLCKNRWEFRDTERALQGSDVIVPSIIFPFFFFSNFLVSSFKFRAIEQNKIDWKNTFFSQMFLFVCREKKLLTFLYLETYISLSKSYVFSKPCFIFLFNDKSVIVYTL